MGKVRVAYYTTFCVFFLLAVNVTGRYLQHVATELVSDGIKTDHLQEERSTFPLLKSSDSEDQCEQMYGFLPCSENLLGHLFLILVYEYLLFHGESYLLHGGQLIFEILGPGIFGASAFPIVAILPESLILLASGLLNSRETAQEHVLTGVGLLAGSTIFILTFLWGTCVFFGRQKFSSVSDVNSSVDSIPVQNQYEKLSSLLTGYGVTTDEQTNRTAKIMLFSLIPFIVISIPNLFLVSYYSGAYKFVVMVTLICSVLSLLGYFFYQMYDHQIQLRRLKYVKVEHEVLEFGIIRHLQGHINERLLHDGSANERAIKILFKKMDRDGDNKLTAEEVKKLLHGMKLSRKWDRDKVMDKMMKDFDPNGDKTITWEEFLNTFKKWLNETKCAMDDQNHSGKTSKHLNKVAEVILEEKRKEKQNMKQLTTLIIKSFPIGDFYTREGTPDENAIRELFQSIDTDDDTYISQSEMQTLIKNLNFNEMPLSEDEAVKILMNGLDENGDKRIDLEEFIKGVRKLNSDDENQVNVMDASAWFKAKAILYLLLGITTLAILAEPLIHSIQKVSKYANIPSFYVSFVLVPLATNARTAISAVKAVGWKTESEEGAAALTFSEMYDRVFMNNVLGFCVLLAIIYFRGLSWHFSGEVLSVFLVCAVIGLAASFRSKFPIWTSFLAYLLYPISLILVYVFNDHSLFP